MPYGQIVGEATLGHLNNVQDLLADGADPNASDGFGRTRLNESFRDLGGFAVIVSVLLGAGAEKDKTSDFGELPLMLAAELGHSAVVETLLGSGADLWIVKLEPPLAT